MTGIIAVKGDKDIRKALGDLRKFVESDRDTALRIVGMEGVKSFQENIRNKRGPNGEPWLPLKSRSGQALMDTRRLYNSITYETHLGSKSVRIGTNVLYSALQHFGGTIRPKKGQYLAIPTTRQIRRSYAGNFRTQFPDAFVIRAKSGANPLWLVRRMTEGSGGGRGRRSAGGGRLQFLAHLLKSVYVPGRPYAGINNEAWSRIRSKWEKVAGNIWTKQGSGEVI